MQTSKFKARRLPGWAVFLGVMAVLVVVDVALSYMMLTYGAESEAVWSSYYQAKDQKIDTVVVGSSYVAHAIDPSALDKSLGSHSWMLGSPAQDPRSSYQAIKAAIEDHHVRRVIYGIGVDSMTEQPWPNAAVVATLAKLQGDSPSRAAEDIAALATDPGFLPKRESLGIMFPWTMGTMGFSRTGIKSNLERRATVPDGLTASLGTLPGWQYQGQGYGNAPGAIDQTAIGNAWNPPAKGVHHLSQNEDELMRMLELCRRNGAEFVVVVVPQPSYFTLGYGKVLCKERAALARRVERGGGRWIDYSMARRDHYRASDDEWLDLGHLNFKGAARFSNVLGRDLAAVEKNGGHASGFYRYAQLGKLLRSYSGISIVTLRTSVRLDGTVHAEATPVAAPGTSVEFRFQLLDASDHVLSQTAYSKRASASLELPDYDVYKVRVQVRRKGSAKPCERSAAEVLRNGESNE